MEINLVYGPPGTGKTTKLLSILEEELTKVSPDKIAFVSFTRKGAYEGRDRAKEKFHFSDDDMPYFRTIHSVVFRELGMSRNDMLNKRSYRMFSEATGMNFTGYYTEELRNDDDKYLFFNDLYRNNPKAADNLLDELNPRLLSWVRKEYKKFKEHFKLYDFTDLLCMYDNTGSTLPVKVAIIDEAQDLTTLQWRVIWKAFGNCERVYIAGDDDQAIYEWSGADVDYLLKIKGNITILDKSWRLPSNIHSYAMGVVAGISNRKDKQFNPSRIGGHVEIANSINEIDINNQTSWMILARNKAVLKDVEQYLKDMGMIYYFKENLSYSKEIISAIIAHHKVCKGQRISDVENLLCTKYLEKDLRNPFTKPWFDEFDLKKEDLDYYRNIIESKAYKEEPFIKVSTIHGVKGGQADNVIFIMDYTKTVLTNFNKNHDSEMRCYYVAVTRAKENLYLVLPTGKQGYELIRS